MESGEPGHIGPLPLAGQIQVRIENFWNGQIHQNLVQIFLARQEGITSANLKTIGEHAKGDCAGWLASGYFPAHAWQSIPCTVRYAWPA